MLIMIGANEKAITKILSRGVESVIEKDNLQKRLIDGKILRVKLGIDPTAKDLHLGHAVILRKLRQFQALGHQIVLIIGDFTAMIGDPSGRSEMRKTLTQEQIQKNMSAYLEQAGLIIDINKTEVRYNSEWYKDKNALFFLDLASKFTVARSLERDDFQKRIKEGHDIALSELLYPILQGYDSIAVKADVELGGTDQTFNVFMGRKVQRRFDMPEQDIMTLTLLEGTDGVHKMSKSLGNYIGLTETPSDMFAKIMSIPDTLMPKYFLLLTDKDMPDAPPKQAKQKLAHTIVSLFCSNTNADKAQE